MHPARALIEAIHAMHAALAEGDTDTVDVDELTLACQDLVSWASCFDPNIAGDAVVSPTDEERGLVADALEAIRASSKIINESRGRINKRLKRARDSRRALGGYGFLKPEGVVRQYVSTKV